MDYERPAAMPVYSKLGDGQESVADAEKSGNGQVDRNDRRVSNCVAACLFVWILFWVRLWPGCKDANFNGDVESPSSERGVASTPPMGWMSWQVFRCETDCKKYPQGCINQDLYLEMAQILKTEGYLDAGYTTVSIDDCWFANTRDKNGRLVENGTRFPDGLKALSHNIHEQGIDFGMYIDIGAKTCEKYVGSHGYFKNDVESLYTWGVDYIKVDGCFENVSDLEKDYSELGSVIKVQAGNRKKMVYSCSWPAYITPHNETHKPFNKMIEAGCNLWRNYDDIACSWGSLVGIIDYFGNYSKYLSKFAGPGHWNDMDMLLVGNDCITYEQSKIQMAIWSIMASPLIMGNDLRRMKPELGQLLLNPEVIAVNQDPLGVAGYRYSPFGVHEVWARELANGDFAVALLNKGDTDIDVPFNFEQIQVDRPRVHLRDIFARKDLGVQTGGLFSTHIKAQSVVFYRVTYLS
mmetsp:Transcript_9561/g.18025  ORF Transcript_9561/g.18025 Transcript_9561/m.18025 type:complete len:464 (-) Transcript_9561:2715-4106(-)